MPLQNTYPRKDHTQASRSQMFQQILIHWVKWRKPAPDLFQQSLKLVLLHKDTFWFDHKSRCISTTKKKKKKKKKKGPDIVKLPWYHRMVPYKVIMFGKNKDELNRNLDNFIKVAKNNSFIFHHRHVTLPARISLTLSRHLSLSSITPRRSSKLYPVSAQSRF